MTAAIARKMRGSMLFKSRGVVLWVRRGGGYNGCVLGQLQEGWVKSHSTGFDHNPHKVMHSGYAAEQA